jgi:hypothetical protein
LIRAWPLADHEQMIAASATRAASTNKLMQAAALAMNEPGSWHVEIELPRSKSSEPLGFDLEIAKPFPAWLSLLPWVLWPLVPIGLFVAHQHMAEKRSRRS